MPKQSSLLYPREKMTRFGSQALSESELWACILGQGTRRLSVFAMARRLEHCAEENSDLSFLPSVQQIRVLAVKALAERWARKSGPALRTPQDIQLLAAPLMSAKQERIWVWYCSVSGEVVHKEQLAQGSLNSVSLAPHEIFSVLRIRHFDSIVLAHNHPSGNLEPSGADIVFTKRIEAACEIMGVWLRDHVILSSQGILSLRERGVVTQQRANI